MLGNAMQAGETFSEERKNGDPLVDRRILSSIPYLSLYLYLFLVYITTYVTHLNMTYTYVYLSTHAHERMSNTYCNRGIQLVFVQTIRPRLTPLLNFQVGETL